MRECVQRMEKQTIQTPKHGPWRIKKKEMRLVYSTYIMLTYDVSLLDHLCLNTSTQEMYLNFLWRQLARITGSCSTGGQAVYIPSGWWCSSRLCWLCKMILQAAKPARNSAWLAIVIGQSVMFCILLEGIHISHDISWNMYRVIINSLKNLKNLHL